VKPWMHEDVLKTWTDAQKRLWESLCSAVPLQPPPGVEAWRETYLKNLASWEAAVRRALEQEAGWVEEWVRRVAQEKGTPEMMAAWVRQMEDVLQRWIQTQNQWWSDYFTVLRRGGFAQPEGSSAESLSVTVEPTPAPAAERPPVVELAAVAAAEPSSATEPSPTAESVAVATAPPTAVEPPVTIEPPPPVTESADDLKLINGIGPALEKKLNAGGVFTFRDLATLSEADIERIEAAIKFIGRIRREDWIGQARACYLQKYGQSL